MKRIPLVLPLMLTLLAACGTPITATQPVPPATESPAIATATETAPASTQAVSAPKLPVASFESQTYLNETAGFALDYPAGWTVVEQAVGPRGSQVQFLSSPEIADLATLPEGATRVTATVYQWDPKNDLAAYVAMQKTAWGSSGFTILEEEDLILELGLPAMQFTVQTPDTTAIFLIAALGDQYLVLSGEGDQELVKEIVQRVRPISVK